MEPFKEEEIKGIICDCEGNKSPDLDGYNINFIKEDYIIAFTDSVQLDLFYWLPVLSKLLASRLKMVLESVISPCHSTFLPRRNILDGVVVVNEILDLARKIKDKCLMFKVILRRHTT